MAARAATTATPPIASRQRGSGRLLALIRLASADRAGTHSNAPFARQSQSFLRGRPKFFGRFRGRRALTREKGQRFDSGWLHQALLENSPLCARPKTRRYPRHLGEALWASARLCRKGPAVWRPFAPQSLPTKTRFPVGADSAAMSARDSEMNSATDSDLMPRSPREPTAL